MSCAGRNQRRDARVVSVGGNLILLGCALVFGCFLFCFYGGVRVAVGRGFEIIFAPLAVERLLVKSVGFCPLASDGRTAIACPGNDPHAIALGDFPRRIFCPVSRAGHAGFLGYFILDFYV